MPIVDAWFFYDNSEDAPKKIAEKRKNINIIIHNNILWDKNLETAKSQKKF